MQKDEKCGIYKIENKINNKIYIGKSIHIYQRWKEHKKKALNNNTKTYFHQALKFYGFNNFKWDIIEEVPLKKLDEREKYWINYYNSIKPNGYNLTEGGEGGCPEFLKKPVRQYDLQGNFIAEYESIQKAGRENSINPQGIYGCCNYHYKSSHNYQWRYAEENLTRINSYKNNKGINHIRVEQYDCDGNYIKTYNSIMEAAYAINQPQSQRSISKCCNNIKYKSVGGYQWKIEGSNKEINSIKKPKSNKKKKVKQFNKDGELIAIFNSSREASRQTGVAQASISNTCLNKQKTGGGFIWQYDD